MSPPVKGVLAVAVGTGSGSTIIFRMTGTPEQRVVLASVSETDKVKVPTEVQLILIALVPCPSVIVPPPESTQL
jgi:hypothetical protein